MIKIKKEYLEILLLVGLMVLVLIYSDQVNLYIGKVIT